MGAFACRMVDNFIYHLGGTVITCGEESLTRGNLIKNALRGFSVNGGTAVEGNAVDNVGEE